MFDFEFVLEVAMGFLIAMSALLLIDSISQRWHNRRGR